MNRELEELIKALDLVLEARTKADYFRFQSVYESRLDAVIARRPGLSRDTLDKAVTIAYHRWLAAQIKPATLPPSA